MSHLFDLGRLGYVHRRLEGYDLVVHLGDLEDSTLISKPLGEDHSILVASASTEV